jgi:hypothetical protein
VVPQERDRGAIVEGRIAGMPAAAAEAALRMDRRDRRPAAKTPSDVYSGQALPKQGRRRIL